MFVLFGVTALGFVSVPWESARAADKDHEKLVGRWELVKGNGGTGVIATAYEFTDKGAVTHTVGKQTWKGTYKVKGNKLILRFSAARTRSATRTLTIEKLQGDVLTVKEGPNELEFMRK